MAKEKIYVLDTSVLMDNHLAYTKFEDNTVIITGETLEELDDNKNGNLTKNFEAREFIREFDELRIKGNPVKGIPVGEGGTLRVVSFSEYHAGVHKYFRKENKYDNRILNVAYTLSKEAENKGKQVILVTRDIALRGKASTLDLQAEDFKTDLTVKADRLYSGLRMVKNTPEKLLRKLQNPGKRIRTTLELETSLSENEFVLLKNGEQLLYTMHKKGHLISFKPSKTIFGIKPLNIEQECIAYALLDPSINLLTISGKMGSGKTLLALAGGLAQRRKFRQILFTKYISGKDGLGYMPGDMRQKLTPRMYPMYENISAIKDIRGKALEKDPNLDTLLANKKIDLFPVEYMQGRTLYKNFLIVDEFQESTQKDAKELIARAGQKTKVVLIGDPEQIHNPYVSQESNGLSHVIERTKESALSAHITLTKSVRSDLSILADKYL